MVQKAVAFIRRKVQGYAAIDDKSDSSCKAISISRLSGLMDAARLGRGRSSRGDNVMDLKDSDGKEVVKSARAAKQEPSLAVL